ncbi:immunity protein Imm33 domain-containing protein [Butyrivibrio sp. WCE2006]
MNMGGSIASRNILENKGRLKLCIREKSVNDLDNGWSFFIRDRHR